MKTWIWIVAVCVAFAWSGVAMGSIYTIGHQEVDGGMRSWLETWTTDFGTRLDIGDVGPAKDPLFGSPHAAMAAGDFRASNPGDEFLLGRADGIGVAIKTDTSSPRLGGALFFRQGSIKHCEDTGFNSVFVAEMSAADSGKEIVTFANDGVMEVWDYDDGASVQDRRVTASDWTGISGGEQAGPYSPTNQAFDGMLLGEFDSGNVGLEVGLLRADGYLEIWDEEATGAWPSSSAYRLGINYLPSTSSHEPWDHVFAGDLLASNPGDEIATIGSDGWYEIYNPMTGARFGAYNDAYAKSGHDPFLAVAADPVPEPSTMLLLLLGVGAASRRRHG